MCYMHDRTFLLSNGSNPAYNLTIPLSFNHARTHNQNIKIQ